MSETPESLPAGESPPPLSTLLRLAVGGALEGSEELWRALMDSAEHARADLRRAPTSTPDESSLDRLRYLLIGLIFEAEEQARLNVTAAPARVEAAAQQAARLLDRVTRPVSRHPLYVQAQTETRRLVENVRASRAGQGLDRTWQAAQERVTRARQRGAGSLEGLIRRGRYEEQFGRNLTRRLAGAPINDIVDYLAENPHVARLVEEQLEELRKNPEPVRELVQGQSVSMATEAVDELREQGVTADNLLENVVRRVLRRPARSSLPPPPLAVRLRAQRQNELDRSQEERP